MPLQVIGGHTVYALDCQVAGIAELCAWVEAHRDPTLEFWDQFDACMRQLRASPHHNPSVGSISAPCARRCRTLNVSRSTRLWRSLACLYAPCRSYPPAAKFPVQPRSVAAGPSTLRNYDGWSDRESARHGKTESAGRMLLAG